MVNERAPFFSVIIPTYNRAQSLPRTLGSLLNQSFPDWEAVVMDDGSTDDTELAMQAFAGDSRVRYFKQVNQGVSTARNAAAARAGGKFIVFLDSDDEFTSGFLAEAHSFVELQLPAVSCFCFSTIFKHPGGRDVLVSPKQLGALYQNKTALFLAGTFVLRRELFELAGGYDVGLAFGENDELGQRICKLTSISNSSFVSLISYRDSTTELNKRYRREAMAKTLVRYLDKYREELARVDPRRLITTYNRLAVCYFVMRKNDEAADLLIQNIKKYRDFKSLRILLRIKLFPSLYRKFLNRNGFI